MNFLPVYGFDQLAVAKITHHQLREIVQNVCKENNKGVITKNRQFISALAESFIKAFLTKIKTFCDNAPRSVFKNNKQLTRWNENPITRETNEKQSTSIMLRVHLSRSNVVFPTCINKNINKCLAS